MIQSSFGELPLSALSQSLQQLMKRAGITSQKELSQRANISEWQLLRLEEGLLPQMKVTVLLKLSQALEVSVEELIAQFCPDFSVSSQPSPQEKVADNQKIKQEYARLEEKLKQQEETLKQKLQQETLALLETYLLQYPTVIRAVENNPQLSAQRLLPLIKTVEKLLAEWDVEAIATVGATVSYDPTLHQLMEGSAEAGDLVQIRYTGYRQGEKLLYRAKVSPLASA